LLIFADECQVTAVLYLPETAHDDTTSNKD